MAVIEAADAATLARTMAPWTAWLSFEVRPILPIEEAARISGEALAWRAANS